MSFRLSNASGRRERQRRVQLPNIRMGIQAVCACHDLPRPLPINHCAVDDLVPLNMWAPDDQLLQRIRADVQEKPLCVRCHIEPRANYWLRPDMYLPPIEGPMCDRCMQRRILEIEDFVGRLRPPGVYMFTGQSQLFHGAPPPAPVSQPTTIGGLLLF